MCMVEDFKGVEQMDDDFGTNQHIHTKTIRIQPTGKIKIPFSTLHSETFSKLNRHQDYTYLLESAEGPERFTRYSLIGFDPHLTIKVEDRKAEINNRVEEYSYTESVEDPASFFRKIVGQKPSRAFRFIGGAVGYISYDTVHYWEKILQKAVDSLTFPDVEMGIFNDGLIFDHVRNETYYYYTEEDRSQQIEQMLSEPPTETDVPTYSNPKVNISREHFEQAVVKAKEYITSGDILQVVLSKRYDFTYKGSLLEFYKTLRRINPSPYMYYLKMGRKQIIGSSPEMLVRVDKRNVETYPIAGTRPTSQDPEKNKALTAEMLSDSKEAAEHIMLVDLARNDIGKVCSFGSVHVSEFMKPYQYSHVQHIVSRVAGRLSDRFDCYDALKAVFPAGTVSGAPKVRAMEIIDELEPARRGPYAGAVGYFSYNGNADFAITIRTLVADGEQAHIQVGAGIVADSVPEKEWMETEFKAEALMKALKTSGGES